MEKGTIRIAVRCYDRDWTPIEGAGADDVSMAAAVSYIERLRGLKALGHSADGAMAPVYNLVAVCCVEVYFG